MKKKKFKLTNEITKSLEKLAATYPEMVHTDKKGNPVYTKSAKSLLYEELTPEDQKRLGRQPNVPVYKMENGKKVVDFYRPARYVAPVRELKMINHFVNLINAYEEKGIEGVQAYTDEVNLITVMNQNKHLIENEKTEETKTTETNEC